MTDAARVLRTGGRILVLELSRHTEVWVRSRFGDRRLGFSSEELRQLLDGAGLTDVRVSIGAGRREHPFAVLVASASKPAGRAAAHAQKAPRAERLR